MLNTFVSLTPTSCPVRRGQLSFQYDHPSHIMNALRKGHVAAVKAALSNSSLNIHQVDEKGCTPLFLACGAKTNRVEIVCLLLDAGSDVTALSGSAGNSVLHYGLVSQPLDRIEKENGSSQPDSQKAGAGQRDPRINT